MSHIGAHSILRKMMHLYLEKGPRPGVRLRYGSWAMSGLPPVSVQSVNEKRFLHFEMVGEKNQKNTISRHIKITQNSNLFIKCYCNTDTLIYTVDGYYTVAGYATMAKLSSCDRAHMATKPNILSAVTARCVCGAVPFTEQVADFWSRWFWHVSWGLACPTPHWKLLSW